MFDNVFILGDSWAWGADLELEFPNIEKANEIYSWGGLISNHYSSNLRLLAKRGCSNREIMMQANSISPSKQDLILVSLTTPYREVIGLNPDKWGKNNARCRFMLADASCPEYMKLYFKNFYSESWLEEQSSIYISQIYFNFVSNNYNFLVFESFSRLPKNTYTNQIFDDKRFITPSTLEYITGQTLNFENDKLKLHPNLSDRLHPNSLGHKIWSEYLIKYIDKLFF